jgi:hypothetical protein
MCMNYDHIVVTLSKKKLPPDNSSLHAYPDSRPWNFQFIYMHRNERWLHIAAQTPGWAAFTT